MFKKLLFFFLIPAVTLFGDVQTSPTTIYLTRHGKTHWNAKKLWQGSVDTHLNKEGIQQALEKATFFQNFSIDAIYSSPLQRALLTAQIIASVYDKEVKPSFAFMEPYLGPLEGMHADAVHRLIAEPLNAKTQEERRKSGYLPGLMSDEILATRVENELIRIAKDHPGKNVLAVTHSTIIEALMSMHTHAIHDTIAMSNMAYLTFCYDGKELKLVDYSSDITFASYPQ